MLIAVAYSLRYERLKNLEFSIKNTWLYEEEKNYQKRNETVVVGGEIDIPYGYEVKYSRYFRHVGLRKITDRGLK